MKTITLMLTDCAYKALRSEALAHFLAHTDGMSLVAYFTGRVVKAIEDGEDEVTLRHRDDQKENQKESGSTRRARVELLGATGRETVDRLAMVQQYLPANYTARLETHAGPPHILIEGEDDHGWTLDGYVIPRLASGLIPAKEVTNG